MTFMAHAGDNLYNYQWQLSVSLIQLSGPLPTAQAGPMVFNALVHIHLLLFQALLFPSSLQRPHRA